MLLSIVKLLNDKNELLGPNKPGEILLKGGTVMKGYIGTESENTFDDDGFMMTGDIGYNDDDENFYIVGRLKELIKYEAFQVTPAEVESVLMEHNSVLDCAVIGKPDPDAGEFPMPFFVLKPNVKCTEQDIKDFVASKLSPTKHLRGGVIFTDTVPKSPSVKVLRKVLRQQLADYDCQLKKSKL